MNYEEECLKQQIDGAVSGIKDLRNAILALYDEGEPLTSERYLPISKRLDETEKVLETLDRQYEDLIWNEA